MLLSEARFGELDAYLFGQGNHNEIYKKLGAHPAEDEKETKVFILPCGHRMRCVCP